MRSVYGGRERNRERDGETEGAGACYRRGRAVADVRGMSN